ITETISLSDFTVLSSAMVSTTWSLIGLSDKFAQIGKDNLFIEKIKSFFSYIPLIDENQKGIEPDSSKFTLEFRNVSFKYSDESDYVIDNMSFILNKNQTTAIVGHNGAGKSTIVKLIIRLYDPTLGDILLNNVNIKKYDLKLYRDLFSVGFQDYQIF